MQKETGVQRSSQPDLNTQPSLPIPDSGRQRTPGQAQAFLVAFLCGTGVAIAEIIGIVLSTCPQPREEEGLCVVEPKLVFGWDTEQEWMVVLRPWWVQPILNCGTFLALFDLRCCFWLMVSCVVGAVLLSLLQQESALMMRIPGVYSKEYDPNSIKRALNLQFPHLAPCTQEPYLVRMRIPRSPPPVPLG